MLLVVVLCRESILFRVKRCLGSERKQLTDVFDLIYGSLYRFSPHSLDFPISMPRSLQSILVSRVQNFKASEKLESLLIRRLLSPKVAHQTRFPLSHSLALLPFPSSP
jgi:hypothetical protein